MDSDIGLYVHIPYCIKKCPYCDFNSYGVGERPGPIELPEDSYLNALIAELEYYSELPAWHERQVRTIFFGGGTPSLFSVQAIEKVLQTINRLFPVHEEVETTLEANPSTIFEELGRDKLRGFREVGVNRISMGVQSFNAEKLKFLGRIHTAESLPAAISNIKAAGFSNFNLDLIFGVSGETLENWEKDLQAVLSARPTHISCYCLTIEPGTEFGRLNATGSLPLLEDDLQAEMFCLTQKLLNQSGYEQYEISNYAKPALECQHNLGYWSGRDYLGVGAGAHSFSKASGSGAWGMRWSNIPGPAQYIARAIAAGDCSQRKEELTEELAELEFFFLGLRLKTGVSPAEYERRFGRTIMSRYLDKLKELSKDGLILESENKIQLTTKGFLFADSVFSAFIR